MTMKAPFVRENVVFVIVALIYLAYASVIVARWCLLNSMPLIQKELPTLAKGDLYAAGTAAYMIGKVFGGPLVDKVLGCVSEEEAGVAMSRDDVAVG